MTVRCAVCGYTEKEEEFINHMCPRCGSIKLYIIKNNNEDKK